MKPIKMIKASAGSGKTYRLMQHLSNSIAAGTAPEKLLSTTYTVKAAAELQSRIREELLRQGKVNEARRVFDGLIGTVNSVCGQLLEQYAIEAGLPPKLDVIPEENASLVFEAAASAVIEKYAENLNAVGERLNLVPVKHSQYQKAADWKDDVKTIVDLARSNNLHKEQLRHCAEESCKALEPIFSAEHSLSLEEIAERIRECADFKGQAKKTQDTIAKVNSFLARPTWHLAGSIAKSGYASSKDPDFPIAALKSVEREFLSSQELRADLCAMINGVFACAAESLEVYDQYKKAWGLIDFVDQESKVLELLRTNQEFGDLLQQRLTQVLVDEFQDTSPIQLALFLKLNEFSENGSIWVGDPKQAIYGFRGTDPELMKTAADAISEVEQLPHSWRSKENLVTLANDIFTQAFADSMPAKEVQLAIPEERTGEAVDGCIEAWHLRGKNNNDRWQALASGIASLIRDEKVLPSDIAVLMKTNSHCAELAKALKTWNIQASAPPGKLLAAPECQLILAAFRYCIDKSDTVAMATILALSGEFPDWIRRLQQNKDAWLALPETDRQGCDPLKKLRAQEILQALGKVVDETPLEILERVITALGLDSRLQKMPFSDNRMSNLEEIRRLCRQYMEQAGLERRAATPAGFAAMLMNDKKIQEAPGFGRNSVNVLTYHKAKGLEWPIVILESLDSDDKGTAFGISVKQAEKFDLANPLQDRGIHYWPCFYGKSLPESLAEKLNSQPLQELAEKRAREEDKRVLYVGLTRAKERLIFSIQRKDPTQKDRTANPAAPDRLGIAWLERLSADLTWSFPMQEGEAEWEIGSSNLPLLTKLLSAPEEPTCLPSLPVFTDRQLPATGQHLPARLAPSQLPQQSGNAELICKLTPQLEYPRCKADEYDLLGNAFHGFFALNPKVDQEKVAARLLSNWQQQDAVKPSMLVTACQRLYDWLESEFPGGSITCEVPMTWRNQHGQLLQGFIDMLIETDDGYVIIDHKTTIKPDPLAEAASHSAQLDIYRQAVEKATGKKVHKTIIHFPLMGICVKVAAAPEAEACKNE